MTKEIVRTVKLIWREPWRTTARVCGEFCADDCFYFMHFERTSDRRHVATCSCFPARPRKVRMLKWYKREQAARRCEQCIEAERLAKGGAK